MLAYSIAPPSITALTPREDTVRQGENAIINCKAQGYPLQSIPLTVLGM